MTTCLEFRRRVGAEPAAADHDLEAHRRECGACARHQDELRAMDGVIRRALEVNLPPRERAGGGAAPARRTRFLAIAASLAAGAAVALFALVAIPRAAIAREVVAHIGHEPGALTSTQPLGSDALDEILSPDGLRLRPGAALSSYCVQGAVRRRLQALGLQVEKRPGLGKKREVLVARKPVDSAT